MSLGLLVGLACAGAPKQATPGEETGGSSGQETGGATGTGGSKATGGTTGTGGATATGGSTGSTGGTGGSMSTGGRGGNTGGSGGSTGGSGGTAGRDAGVDGPAGTGGTGAGGTSGSDCGSMAGLTWKTARKTWYTSYPAPGSKECITYSGCQYQGQFAACSGVKSKAWVMAHNIAAFFPLGNRQLHDICIKANGKSMIVTVYDTCGDGDCGGCCTQNKGSHDALIDLESFTNQRWGMDDGTIMWADLGPTKSGGCN